MFGLIDRVLDGLEPHAPARKGGVAGAIARRENIGIGCRGVFLDRDAILANEARLLRDLAIGDDADTHKREIGGHDLTADSYSFETITAQKAFDARAKPEDDAMGPMLALPESRHLPRGRPRHDAIRRLENRDLQAVLCRDG